MKCEICKNDSGATFLEKPLGTFVKDERGKERFVCSSCQKTLRTKDKILEQLK